MDIAQSRESPTGGSLFKINQLSDHRTPQCRHWPSKQPLVLVLLPALCLSAIPSQGEISPNHALLVSENSTKCSTFTVCVKEEKEKNEYVVCQWVLWAITFLPVYGTDHWPQIFRFHGPVKFPPPPAAPIFWVDNLFCHVRTSLKNQHCPLPVLLLIVVKYTYYTTQPFLSLQVLGIKYIGVV